MLALAGRVAVVTGASRGLGQGIATALGEAGATVYVSARSALDDTAAAVEAAGGRAVPVPCDHRDDRQVEALFERVQTETGRLDLLVNNATAIPADLDQIFGPRPFWEVPVDTWDALIDVGLRSHFVATRLAVPLLLRATPSLVVNISAPAAQVKAGILPYAVGKAALDRMTADMAADLADTGVSVISLWPPPSRTESMLAAASSDDVVARWSETVFTGRVIAALHGSGAAIAEHNGGAVRVRELAARLGVPDTIAGA